MQSHSLKFLRQRQFLLTLPLLVLPFVVILFAILGGGSGKSTKDQKASGVAGINLHLPDAYFKTRKEQDKLGLYETMRKDSLRFRESIQQDPYYKPESTGIKNTSLPTDALEEIFEKSAASHPMERPDNLKASPGKAAWKDPNEEKVMAKLAQLQAAIHPNGALSEKSSGMRPSSESTASNSKPDDTRTAKMPIALSAQQEKDPEMEQLNGLLDKVMAIQHPGITKDSTEKTERATRLLSYPVHLASTSEERFTSGTQGDAVFNDLGDTQQMERPDGCIAAIIPESQTWFSGSTVKLRLLNDIHIHGMLVPKNQLIYGTGALANERYKIEVRAVRIGNTILPVSLDAYDLDGLPGIFIPGSMTRDAIKQSGDQAMSSLGLATLDPSIGAQAAGAGIQAARTLLSRKVKLVRVTVKAGYKILLKDSHAQ